MKKQIEKINRFLISHFGIPNKAKVPPDPLDMLIATILSQNTNDKNSYKAFRNLKDNFKTWDELAELKPSQIEKLIKVAGLGKQKSGSIYKLLQTLKKNQSPISLNYIKQNSNESVLEELTSYTGIGTKTASCVLLFSLERDICPVDTHVHRTLNRIGIVSASTPDKTFVQLHNQFPTGIAHSFHTNLIRLGRELCKPAKPVCPLCPVRKMCRYPEKNLSTPKMIRKNDFMLLDNVSDM